MKPLLASIVLSLLVVTPVAVAAAPDLGGCWDVTIDQIDSEGVKGSEHNTVLITPHPADSQFFSGFVCNLPDTEEGRNFSGVVVGKTAYFTHWDSITEAQVMGKKLRGVNQAFDADNRASKTALATAVKLGAAHHCCSGDKDQDETDVDCGGATCGGCFTDMVCIDDSDCLSNNCDSGSCAEPLP
jgi:hypothetical protein